MSSDARRRRGTTVVDQALFLRMLSEFARTLVVRYEIADVLYELAARTTTLLDVAGAGVSLRDEGRLRFVTGIDEATVRVEQGQERLQQGVCVEAFTSGKPVTVPNLADIGDRWAEFRDEARAVGFAAVLGIPMCLDHDVLGAVNIYSAQPRDWSDDDIATAQVLADMATSYLVNASELEKSRRTAEQLQEALQSRVVIEQAKGILSAERKMSLDDAFNALRDHARNHNANLRAVAEAVVNLGLRP
jgi:GAF domain-containing protein